MGHVRVAFGALDVESQCAWAMVQSNTAAELNNHEGGDNCGGSGPSLSPSPPTTDAVFLTLGLLKQCAQKRSCVGRD